MAESNAAETRSCIIITSPEGFKENVEVRLLEEVVSFYGYEQGLQRFRDELGPDTKEIPVIIPSQGSIAWLYALPVRDDEGNEGYIPVHPDDFLEMNAVAHLPQHLQMKHNELWAKSMSLRQPIS